MSFAHTTLVLLINTGNFFGKLIPDILADRFGRFNVITATIFLCAVTVLASWLPATNSTALIIIFAISFGLQVAAI